MGKQVGKWLAHFRKGVAGLSGTMAISETQQLGSESRSPPRYFVPFIWIC
uniref:Uncharacterized protein n=2 Tax=Anguilla anguilla TaxID=7936 RepID=A0A0E9VNI0_ANGAN